MFFSFIISFSSLKFLFLIFIFICYRRLAVSCLNFVIIAALKSLYNSTIWLLLALISAVFSHSSCDFYVSWNDRYFTIVFLGILSSMLEVSGSNRRLLFQQSFCLGLAYRSWHVFMRYISVLYLFSLNWSKVDLQFFLVLNIHYSDSMFHIILHLKLL